MTASKIRNVLGVSSLFLLAIAVNVVVMRENAFHPFVYVPLLLSAAAGLGWFVLSVTTVAGSLRGGKALAGLNSLISSLIFLGICIALFAFATLWDAEWDLTREGRRALAEQTVQVLENLNEDVTVTAFFLSGAVADDMSDVAREKTRRFLDRCASKTPRLNVEFVDPQRNPERLKALDVQRFARRGTVVIESGARRREVPISDVTNRLDERDFTNALINAIRDNNPTIYFLTGHDERSIEEKTEQGASDFRLWLDREGYVAKPLLLSPKQPQVPADCSLVVLNGYESDLRVDEIGALDFYVASGGSLLVMVEPSYPLEQGVTAPERLRPWLAKRFGVELGQNMVITLMNGQPSPQVLLYPGVYNEEFDPETQFKGSFNQGHPITRGHDQLMQLPTVRTVEFSDPMPDGAAGQVLLRTMTESYAEEDLRMLLEKRAAVQDPDEAQGFLPIAAAVSIRNEGISEGARPDGRLVVIGDTDLSSNASFAAVGGHHNFLLNAVAWLTESEDLIAIRPTGVEDAPIVLSMRQEQIVAWICALGAMQAVVISGLIVFYFRRKHQ